MEPLILDNLSEISIKNHAFVLAGVNPFIRQKLQKVILENGGILQKQVTAQTTYLILHDEKAQFSIKYHDALAKRTEKGLPLIITADAALKLFETGKIPVKAVRPVTEGNLWFRELPTDKKIACCVRYLSEKLPDSPLKPVAVLPPYIRRNKARILKKILQEDDAAAMTHFMELLKRISLDTIDDWIEKNPEALAIRSLLMEYKKQHFTLEEIENAEKIREEKIFGLREYSAADWRKIYKFSYKENGVILKEYRDEEIHVVIPEKIGDKPVVELGDNIFKGKNIASALLPETLLAIGSNAFRGCRELQEVYIDNPDLFMGDGAFAGCTALANDQGFIEIEKVIFDYCGKKIQSEILELPSGLKDVQTLALEKLPRIIYWKDEKSPTCPNNLEKFTNAQLNNTLFFGRFPLKRSCYLQPIPWKVIKKEAGRLCLITESTLHTLPYHNTWQEITWEKCDLRNWLNDVFYNFAFSAEEKKHILLTSTANKENPRRHATGGNNTQDHVFILSIDEANRYFADDSSRIAAPTPYAAAHGGWMDENGGSPWWLRSPGGDNYNYFAAHVRNDGSVYVSGSYVHNERIGVRPVIWIEY